MRGRRIIAVTGLLAILGGLAGAVGGLLIISAVAAAFRVRLEFIGTVFAIAAAVGSATGFVAGPTLTWLLLRRVPIWRAVGETAMAAAIAAMLALVLDTGVVGLIAWPVAASLAAALRLRWAYRNASVTGPIDPVA